MDTTQFLARVIAPGNYIAIAYKSTERGGVSHRFFPYDTISEAGSYAKWCASRRMDVWHAVASYKLAAPDGKGYYRGERKQENAQSLKCFWLDADIKRPGDKKSPDKVYADMMELAAWTRDFSRATGIPLPNLWVNSGYGVHLYWVLEDSMTPQDWRVQAEAFKAALIANHAKGDVSTTADSARILRPPETLNYKVAGSPASVVSIDKLARGDYPNQLILQALQPYVVAASQKVSNGGASVINGSPPSVFALRSQATSNATTAAQTIPNRREYLFAEIAKRCVQVENSLSVNGNGDAYPLWYLGFISLAVFCADGAIYAHEISKGDPRYDPAKVDAALQQAERERRTKGTGAPTCVAIDGYRPGVCNLCPHYRRVTSPYTLGVEDGNGDLPDGYVRGSNRIMKSDKDEDGNITWEPLIDGDVYMPILDRIGEDRKLIFTYDRAGSKSTVSVLQSEISWDLKHATRHFGPQGVTLNDRNARDWWRFIVAWIEKLRDMRAERNNPIPPFGWVPDGAEYSGLSVGGTCYHTDGTEEPAPGGDPKILAYFKPRGTLDGWRAACDFVIKDRPDLQILVAAAFAAPLIEFTGHNGFIMSAWSRDSAVGKSSALVIGATVWADTLSMINLDDTPNSIVHRIGHTRITPAYWDEITLKRDDEDKFVATLFQLGQGKEKARLNPDATLKQSGDWKTILVTTGNRPLMDLVMKQRSDTDAGAVRLFEFLLEHPQMPLNTMAAQTIISANKHAGNAGRIYAAWLAKNYKVARTYVTALQTKLEQSLGAMQQERFFISGMACLLVGAALARSLGLASFDTADMRDFLKQAFLKLREDRNTNLPVNAGYFDIERVFADFVADNAADRLVTKHFQRPGPHTNNTKVEIVWAPRKTSGRLAIHVGQIEKKMRIDANVWRSWCYTHGFSPSDVTRQMELRWNAKRTRTVLGAGTDFAAGKIDVVEIPLIAPELAEYNYSYDSNRKRV